MKKRIAIIVQRYGLEVNGGAEYHCRLIAEKLKENYTIDILTSCAKDYITWANEYKPGLSALNGVNIRRFPVEHTRDLQKFKTIGRKLKKRKPHQKILKLLNLLVAFEELTNAKTNNQLEIDWINEQGPFVPNLLNYLKEQHTTYDVLVFFTYLYYPTAFGLEIAPHKSILIPTAHDEPPIYLQFFRRFFQLPAAILYNTISEKLFVNQLFNNNFIYDDIVAIGVEYNEPKIYQDVQLILNTTSKYIIYIGRIETSKECDQLISYFINYKSNVNNDIKLVFVGEAFMQLTQHPDIIYTGFVSEDVKLSLLRSAEALVIPSKFESLSMVTLESMVQGIPVIANEKSDVLKDHIINSNAGFLYSNQHEFSQALAIVLSPDTDKTSLKINARKYISENYSWSTVLSKIDKAINYVLCS